MDITDVVRWLHVLGACILLGTGTGIAFFMMMAHQSGRPAIIAHTTSVVVIADTLFTATSVVVQPITGIVLANLVGWSLTEGWIVLSLALYLLTGLFWLPVVWIQMKIRNIARAAETEGSRLPDRYFGLFRIWFACGIPAFCFVLAIVWLMVARPNINLTAIGL